MKTAHLALIGITPHGRVEHPLTDAESVCRVLGWLSPLVSEETVWACEEVD